MHANGPASDAPSSPQLSGMDITRKTEIRNVTSVSRTRSAFNSGWAPLFIVAEKSAGSYAPIAFLRWALVIVFLWFGGMKFTAYEANGIAPFIQHSPFLSWLNFTLGVQGASNVIGTIEILTAAALIAGAFNAFASAIGAAMSCTTYLITVTFFFSTPGVAEASAGGFPAISASIGQFLLKDVVLLAASVCLGFASIQQCSRGKASNV